MREREREMRKRQRYVRLKDGGGKKALVYFFFPTAMRDPVFPFQAKFGIN